MQESTKTDRDRAPDAIKGLCIILMVFGHIAHTGSLGRTLAGITAFIYTFHMPVFLMISGYYFNFEFDLKARTLKVLLKIGVPYIIFFSVYLLGLILIQYTEIPTTNQAPNSIKEFISAIFLFPYGAYWFLHSLIFLQLTLLFSKSVSCRICGDKETLGPTILIALILMSVWSELGVVSFRTATYFMCGVLIHIIFKKHFFVPSCLFTVMTIVFYVIDSLGPGNIHRFLTPSEVVWCLLIFSTLWSFFQKNDNMLITFLAWIGRNTLIVLVLHALFVVMMKPLNIVFLNIDPTGLVHSITVTFLSISLCLISARILDIMRLSRFIFLVETIYNRWG